MSKHKTTMRVKSKRVRRLKFNVHIRVRVAYLRVCVQNPEHIIRLIMILNSETIRHTNLDYTLKSSKQHSKMYISHEESIPGWEHHLTSHTPHFRPPPPQTTPHFLWHSPSARGPTPALSRRPHSSDSLAASLSSLCGGQGWGEVVH